MNRTGDLRARSNLAVSLSCFLLILTRPAMAENPTFTNETDSADKERAIALHEEGSEEYRRGRWHEAAESYRAALQHWNHPQIHADLGMVLAHAEDFEEALEHLETALRHASVLEPQQRKQAGEKRQELLEEEFAELVVRCHTKSLRVWLSGTDAELPCRTQTSYTVLAGDRTLVFAPADAPAVDRAVFLQPGRRTVVEVGRKPSGGQWSRATVSGLALSSLVGAIGVELHLASNRSMARGDERAELCYPSACQGANASAINDLYERGKLQRRGAQLSYGVAASILLTTVVLAALQGPSYTTNVQVNTSRPMTILPWRSTRDGVSTLGLSIDTAF